MSSKLPIYLRRFGVLKGGYLYFLLKSKRKREVSFRIPQVPHPIHLRLGTSDHEVFNQIFLYGEYEGVRLDFAPETFLDGGGNIGLAAVYFANRFPRTRILTVEPEPENFRILQKNIAGYPQIRAVLAGLWPRKAHLAVRNIGAGEWGFVVEETDSEEPGAVPAESVDSLLEQTGWPRFDVVKLDIEGSESELFRQNTDGWLPQARALIIELHEWMKAGSSASFLKAVSSYPFRRTVTGENEVYVRTDL
ncbi:FkbM family methyltransferase [Larkinella soli]|uniref:FkbM family methyltransferase n=1 Tax=Larkinella soli TaxID=1770527 RepID=UPI000FFB509D|nr:FkbM family methyltransferase [Larkinella soli]